jgi:hypothetical protein
MMQSADEFLSCFGDVVDDRVAGVLDEMLDDRDVRLPRRRLRPVLAALGLVLPLAACVVLRHSVLGVRTVWPSTAAIHLAAIRTTRTGRS